MRPGQRPPAELAVQLHAVGLHPLDHRRSPSCRAAGARRSRGPAVDALDPVPAQEDVAGRLHEPLAGHDALARGWRDSLGRRHMGSSTEAWASFTCRNSGSSSSRPRSSTIQQRVPTLPTPTTLRARSTNSNWSSSTRRVGRQGASVAVSRPLRSRAASSSRQASRSRSPTARAAAGRCDPRAGRPRSSVSFAKALRLSWARALARSLVETLASARAASGARASTRTSSTSSVGVPDVERSHGGELAHGVAVRRTIAPATSLRAALRAKPLPRAGHDEARGEALDVPLPGAGQRLVEVVDVEEQAALGGGEDPEVRQVRVTAQLHAEAGDRASHRGRRPSPGRAPRKKAKGDTIIRPWRTGTSSGTRTRACSSKAATGSGRTADSTSWFWSPGGSTWRASSPSAVRSSGPRRATPLLPRGGRCPRSVGTVATAAPRVRVLNRHLLRWCQGAAQR